MNTIMNPAIIGKARPIIASPAFRNSFCANKEDHRKDTSKNIANVRGTLIRRRAQRESGGFTRDVKRGKNIETGTIRIIKI